MKNELLDHMVHCGDCHALLRHVFALRLIKHLVFEKFTEADAQHTVSVVYSRIGKLRQPEVQS